MIQLRHWLNYEPAEAINFEHPVLPSMTVPDMAMSISEIIAKHSIGQPLNISYREPIWNGDVFVPDAMSLDLAERQELSEQYKAEAEEKREEHNQQLKDYHTQQQKDEAERLEREELLKEFKASKKQKKDVE